MLLAPPPQQLGSLSPSAPPSHRVADVEPVDCRPLPKTPKLHNVPAPPKLPQHERHVGERRAGRERERVERAALREGAQVQIGKFRFVFLLGLESPS